MTDLEKAKQLFQKAGLVFPAVPQELAVQLKELDNWLFSTREIEMSPYILQHYVHECDPDVHEVSPASTPPLFQKPCVDDYAVLSHSGHGVNSYAIQYYLVHGPLRMFLHLGWGGVYADAEEDAAHIRDCFSLADRIVPPALAVGKLPPGHRLTIVGSDFYGSYWEVSRGSPQKESGSSRSKDATEILTEVLNWLTGSGLFG